MNMQGKRLYLLKNNFGKDLANNNGGHWLVHIYDFGLANVGPEIGRRKWETDGTISDQGPLDFTARARI